MQIRDEKWQFQWFQSLNHIVALLLDLKFSLDFLNVARVCMGKQHVLKWHCRAADLSKNTIEIFFIKIEIAI